MHVVLLAHGSRDPRHAETIGAIAHTLDERSLRASVSAAYLDLCPPTLADAVRGLPHDEDVIVVPMLLTAAFHAGTDVPAAVAAARAARPDLAVRTSVVLGPAPELVAAMERRIAEAGASADAAGTAVLLVAAGSSDDDARAEVASLTRDWLAPPRAGGHAFASGPGPGVADALGALAAAGATRIVIAPYFLAPGVLADRAVDEARAAGAAAGVEVVVAEVIGDAPEMFDLVPARARSAAS